MNESQIEFQNVIAANSGATLYDVGDDIYISIKRMHRQHYIFVGDIEYNVTLRVCYGMHAYILDMRIVQLTYTHASLLDAYNNSIDILHYI